MPIDEIILNQSADLNHKTLVLVSAICLKSLKKYEVKTHAIRIVIIEKLIEINP